MPNADQDDAPTPGKKRFRNAYRSGAPWEAGQPQPALVEIADQVTGKVLDAGCGSGDNALFFAKQGCEVLGIDFLEEPLQLAAHKITDPSLKVQFEQKNALQLTGWQETFDWVIDCGLFHTFDAADRQKYVAGLKQITQPGSRVVILCFSDAEPPGNGPRRISEADLRETFQQSWKILSLTPTTFAVRADLPKGYFSPGGPQAWRLIVERI